MKDPARLSGGGRLGDPGVLLLENRKVRETNSPAQVFWKVVQYLGAITDWNSLVWFLGWRFLASKGVAGKTCSSHLRGCLRRWKFFCVSVAAANPQSGLVQQSQSTPCPAQLGILEAAGGKNRRWQQVGIWRNWEVLGSVCCLFSHWAWWRHSVRKYFVLLAVLLAS